MLSGEKYPVASYLEVGGATTTPQDTELSSDDKFSVEEFQIVVRSPGTELYQPLLKGHLVTLIYTNTKKLDGRDKDDQAVMYYG